MSGELESLYAKLAAGNAKRRPARAPLAIDAMVDNLSSWTSTTAIIPIYGLNRSNTLRLLKKLYAEGILERRRRAGNANPYEWRRRKANDAAITD